METTPEPSISPAITAPQPLFFPVSILKLAVLAVTTLGLYELYWAYQNWKLIKERGRPEIMPFWRAFFGVIWSYPLMKEIRENERAVQPEGHARLLCAGPLATVYILLIISWRLPDPFSLISLFSFLPLLAVQEHVNRLNAAAVPGHDPNSRFTWANCIWIILGGILVVLACIGALTPDTSTSSP